MPKCKELLHTGHSDACGSFRKPSPEGAKHFMTFTGEYPGYTKQKQKNEALEMFEL